MVYFLNERAFTPFSAIALHKKLNSLNKYQKIVKNLYLTYPVDTDR